MKWSKRIAILVGLAALAGTAEARQIYVPGHYLANGAYVQPHYQNVPDGVAYDQYGNQVYGNSYSGNPYAGNPYSGNPYVNPNPYANGVVPNPYPYRAAPYVPAPAYAPNYYGAP